MSKWADYGVFEVRYSTDPKRIAEIKVRKDNDERFGPVIQWSKDKAVTELVSGTTLITVFEKNGTPTKGALVEKFPMNGTWYIRTDADKIPEDNLGELPRY
jgi:Protein of unknown function (DUF3892)